MTRGGWHWWLAWLARLAMASAAAMSTAGAVQTAPGTTAPIARTPSMMISQFWQLPNLTTSDGMSAYRGMARGHCKTVALVYRDVTNSGKPGTIVGQNPAAGTMISCQTLVTATRSTGPMLPKQWPMPDLTAAHGLVLLQLQTQQFCYREASPSSVLADSNETRGTIVGQRPYAETMIDCSSAITMIRSAGPPPTPSWTMPDLTVATGIDQLTTQTRLYCRRDPSVTIREAVNNAPKATIIGQYPAAKTEVTCATRMSLTRSLGPPLVPPPLPRWSMPDLKNTAGVAELRQQFVKSCKTTAVIASEYRDDKTPRDTIVGQRPDVGKRIRCKTAFTAIRSNGSLHHLLSKWSVGLVIAALVGVGAAIAVWPFPRPTIKQGSITTIATVAGTLGAVDSEIAVDIAAGPPVVNVITPITIAAEEVRDA